MSGRAAVQDVWSEPAPRAISRLGPDEHLPQALAATAAAVGGLMARICEDRFGVSIAEWRSMALIAAEDGETGAARLSCASAGRPVADHSLHALVWRGVVERTPAGARLTPAGRRLYERILPLAAAYEATLVAGLTPGEVAALKLLLKRLRSAAERLGGEGS
jgi:DNA-binding MarR family transcriptional regulator